MVWGRSTSPTQKYVVDHPLVGCHQLLVDRAAVTEGEQGISGRHERHHRAVLDRITRGCLALHRIRMPVAEVRWAPGLLGVTRSRDEGSYGRANDLGAAGAVLLSALVDRGYQTVVHTDWDDPRRTIPDGAASSLLQHFDVVSTFRFVSPLLDRLVGDWRAINGFHVTSVIRNTCLNVAETVMVSSVAYRLARLILPMCRSFSSVAASAMSSAMLWGTTCQDTPQRSTHQPQRSASGTADRPAQ